MGQAGRLCLDNFIANGVAHKISERVQLELAKNIGAVSGGGLESNL
jgi:hypothetical protein